MPEEASNVGEAIEQVSSLLRGQPVGKPDEPTESGLATAPKAAPADPEPQADPVAEVAELTPKAIAERLGISPDKLFTEMLIPVDGGEPLTLEEFKADGQGLRGLKAAQHELAEEKVTFENNVMLQKQTLERAIAKIPPEALTGEMVAEVQAEHETTLKRERAALLTIRPALRDPAVWNATRDLLVAHLQPYGFREIEVDSIVDHRLAKYVIDNAEREKRLKEIDVDSLEPENATKLARPSQKPRAPSKRATDEPAAKRKGNVQEDKVAKVAELIGAANK